MVEIQPAGERCEVILLPSAERAVRRHWPRTDDAEELRRQIGKLQYWRLRTKIGKHKQLLDLSWCRIRACTAEQIYELRIAGRIGNIQNIRVIFYPATVPETKELMIIVLTVMPKKRQQFTTHDIEVFRGGQQNALAMIREFMRMSKTVRC